MQQGTLNNEPDRYAVIGNPVAHSKSPEIHLLFAEQTGENISYEKILAEEHDFARAAEEFFRAGGKGLNVTLPFKIDACRFVNRLTDLAEHAGAVNTIIDEGDGNYLGANTDGIGLLRDLKKTLRLQLLHKKILIIGAGGATQGIVESLLNEEPAELLIANRTLARAAEIAERFQAMGEIQSCGLSRIPVRPYDLIIHATSAVLHGHGFELPTEIVGPQTFCYDLLYGRGDDDTPFMQWGRSHGAANVVDGFGMLLEQAAESFYLWRDKRPDTTMAHRYLRPQTAT